MRDDLENLMLRDSYWKGIQHTWHEDYEEDEDGWDDEDGTCGDWDLYDDVCGD